MSAMVKNKLLSGLVILLLLANIATLAMFWFNFKKEHKSIKHQEAKDFLIKELSFTETQQKQYGLMVEEHRKQSRETREQLRMYKDSLFNLLSDEQVPAEIQSRLTLAIATLEQQMETITFNHFREVRKICNPEQQKKFDTVIKDVLRMMAAPLPGGRPPFNGPGPHHDPPPPGEAMDDE